MIGTYARLLTVALGCSFAVGAEAQQPAEPPAQQQSAEPPAQQQPAEPPPQRQSPPAESNADGLVRAPAGEDDDVFIPTEEIPADEEVTFPVNI